MPFSLETELPNINSGQFLQYVADNVDHNTRTIDRLNTFHGMGMIATVTPCTEARRGVPRITVTKKDVAAVGHIKIKYSKSCNGLGALKYQVLKDMQQKWTQSFPIDLLWKVSLAVQAPRPSWSGMVQAISKGNHPGQSYAIMQNITI